MIESIEETIVHARADLPDQAFVRAYLADHTDEYYGILHQRDVWTQLNSNGGGVLIRTQVGIPKLHIRVDRPVREPILVEHQQTRVVSVSDDAVATLGGFQDESLIRANLVVIRAREMWLRENLRIYVDIVDGCGIFLSVDAVVDDTFLESVCRQQVQALLHALRIPDSAVVPKSYAELLNEARATAEICGDELQEIRRRNFEELQKRMILLRPMPDDDDLSDAEEKIRE